MRFAVVLAALGVDPESRRSDAPELNLLGMALAMSVPMVAWMRYRGHGSRPSAEMAASMFLPTFTVVGMLAAGIGSVGGLMVVEHVAMLLGMLGVMLTRPVEYTHHHGHASAQSHVELQPATA